MKHIALLLVILAFISTSSVAQKDGGFKAENLFTGGSLSLGFGSNTFQVGASPFLGYSVASWLDAGVLFNYNYTSYRDVFNMNDKLRNSTIGGGVFTKIYPIDFLFVHAQFERNFTTQKYIPGNNGTADKSRFEANSLLLGAGYASGRYPGSGQPFFYISLLFDVLNEEFSPYTNSSGSIIPILRAGVQVPLFQKRGFRDN